MVTRQNLAGTFAAIILGFKVVEVVLDFLGNLDLVVTRIEDPGWLGTAINFLFFEPPAWFSNLLLLLALGLLVYVSISLRQKQTAATDNATAVSVNPKRISLIDFFKEAEKQGWEVASDDKLHLLDLADGLSQAASFGEIKIYGRPTHSIDLNTQNALLQEVSTASWKEIKIDGLSCAKLSNGEVVGLKDDNFKTSIKHKIGGQVYADIYLDRGEALHWLGTDASQFKGRTKQIHYGNG